MSTFVTDTLPYIVIGAVIIAVLLSAISHPAGI